MNNKALQKTLKICREKKKEAKEKRDIYVKKLYDDLDSIYDIDSIFCIREYKIQGNDIYKKEGDIVKNKEQREIKQKEHDQCLIYDIDDNNVDILRNKLLLNIENTKYQFYRQKKHFLKYINSIINTGKF